MCVSRLNQCVDREMVKLVSCLVVLLAASVAPQRKFRLFNALFTDCGKFFLQGTVA
jgi:hypothetical protein